MGSDADLPNNVRETDKLASSDSDGSDGAVFECDCEQRLHDEILEACHRAYENGASLSDIFVTLHNYCWGSTSPDKPENLPHPTPSSEFHLEASTSTNYGVGWNPTRTRSSESVLIRYSAWKISLSFLALVAIAVVLAPFLHFLICHVSNTNPLKVYPNLAAQRCLISLHATILEMIRPLANCSTLCTKKPVDHNPSLESLSPVIELKLQPSREEFEKIAYSSWPTIVRNPNPSLPYLNFSMLKDIFESEPGGVESVSEDCQFLPFRSSFTSLADAFLKISAAEDHEHGPSEPWYIGWSNCHPNIAARLRALFPRPDFFPPHSESSIIDWIFVGSSGSGAAMHIDYVRRPSWQLQLSGVKIWTLRPPPECESECINSISFTSHAGDYVFLETNVWYHETFIEGPELSISIGSEYD